MELTLKRLLEQAEFTQTKGRPRGYDQAEVDELIDRAAAMAAQVEAHMQALEAAAASGTGGGPSAADIEAEIERRVAERMAALPPNAGGPSDEQAAEEAHRTLLLAQRTADAAVREAREDAEKLLADARERAETLDTESRARADALTEESESRAAALTEESEARAASIVAEAEAKAAATLADVEAQAARERREARQRLAGEIGELEGIRESLRADVTVLERHVEEQRVQLASTAAELQRLLEDPSGFRLAPVPALADPELPDLSDAFEPEPMETFENASIDIHIPGVDDPITEPSDGPLEFRSGDADDDEPADGSVADQTPSEDEGRADGEAVSAEESPTSDAAAGQPDGGPAPAAESATTEPPPAVEVVIDDSDAVPPTDQVGDTESSSAAEFGVPAERPATVAQPLAFDEVDHEAPEIRQNAAEDTGPATAPIAAVDLGLGQQPPTTRDDDAFLAELRKAMADDEPLGPRDHDDEHAPPELFDDDRRSWRFGRRR